MTLSFSLLRKTLGEGGSAPGRVARTKGVRRLVMNLF